MRLYMFPVAPNPTRVRLQIAEKRAAGADLSIEEVAVNLPEGEQRGPEHRARSPFGRLPALELDDGSVIFESRAIMGLIEELHPEPPLLGTSPVERARAADWERVVELELLGPVARWVHATRSPLGMPPNPELARLAMEMIERGIAVLDERLADGRPFVMGDHVTLADCTLAAALQFGRFRELPWPEAPHVMRWDAAYRGRAPAQSVLVV